MKWKEGRRSQNVEDRRSLSVPGGAKGVGLGAVVVLVIAAFLGGDPGKLLEALSGAAAGPVEGGQTASAEENTLAEFASVVLASTEDVWTEQFRKMGRSYELPKLVLFRGGVESACGMQSAAVGPFYCPGDHNAYLDLSFFDDLHEKFGAPGDFAQAYVIAHEIGHHVQNLLGASERVHRAQQGKSEAQANDLSVRLELQADFYAGVWAHYAEQKFLEEGDLEEALNAAQQIGDDRLQMRSRGYVAPDSFTHGSSAQRKKWFLLGFRTGDLSKGDTFTARDL